LKKTKLINLLTKYNIPIESWGTGEAKTIEHLLREIDSGETILVENTESQELIRKFSFLSITIFCTNNGTTYRLHEAKQIFTDGRTRERKLDSSMGEKIKPAETDITESIGKALNEELGIHEDFEIRSDEITHSTKEADSRSYPGLKSLRERFDAVVEIKPSQFNPDGYTEVSQDKTTYFAWEKVSVD
jgi:hypothetical protein